MCLMRAGLVDKECKRNQAGIYGTLRLPNMSWSGVCFHRGSALSGTFLGGGHDAHVDGGHVDAAAGMPRRGWKATTCREFSAFSPTVIACFNTAFGGWASYSTNPRHEQRLVKRSTGTGGAYLIAYCVLSADAKNCFTAPKAQANQRSRPSSVP